MEQIGLSEKWKRQIQDIGGRGKMKQSGMGMERPVVGAQVIVKITIESYGSMIKG